MIVRAATDWHVRQVFGAVTGARAAELTATAWHDKPAVLAEEIIALRGGKLAPLFAIFQDTTIPCAIVGVLPFGPGWGGMVWAAAETWPRLVLPSHRWWWRDFVPKILQPYYRRVEFTALASDKASRRWLKTLGFTEEGIAYRQGKHGEDFVHMAWLNPDPAVGITHV